MVDELRLLTGRVQHRRLQHVNSISVDGGVTEFLTRMVLRVGVSGSAISTVRIVLGIAVMTLTLSCWLIRCVTH
jgi:hypothetical protein